MTERRANYSISLNKYILVKNYYTNKFTKKKIMIFYGKLNICLKLKFERHVSV